jgi:hypothetical protein
MWEQLKFRMQSLNRIYGHLYEGVIIYNRHKKCQFCNDTMAAFFNVDKNIFYSSENRKSLSFISKAIGFEFSDSLFRQCFWMQKSFLQFSSLNTDKSLQVTIFPKYNFFNQFDGLLISVKESPENERLKQLHLQLEKMNDLLVNIKNVQHDSFIRISELSDAENNFINDFCLKFRNHLNAIYGFSQLLEMEDNMPDEASAYTRHVLAQCKELILLINQLSAVEVAAQHCHKQYLAQLTI